MHNLGAHKFYITWRSTVCIVQGNLQTGPRVPVNKINTREIHLLCKCLFHNYEMHGESVKLDIIFNLFFCLDSFEHLDSLADVSHCRAP